MPALQGLHEASAEAPGVEEYVPEMHAPEHNVAPVAAENFPAGQSLHAEAPGPPAYLPDPQSLIRQVEDDEAPTTGEYVPAAQQRHGSVHRHQPLRLGVLH